MNSTLSASNSRRHGLRVSRSLVERTAARAGLALLAWSRRSNRPIDPEVVAEQRRLQLEASRMHSEMYAALALMPRNM